MSKETSFTITEEQIFNAERQRTEGRSNKAVEATQPVMEFPLDQFTNLDEDGKKRVMMAARVLTVTQESQANHAWAAPRVAYHLARARRTITEIYRHPDVQNAAYQIKNDTRNNPYEFDIEMARDEVDYLLKLAALTGNVAFLNDAVLKLNYLIERSKEPTNRTLLVFNKNRLLYNAKQTEINWRVLKRSYLEAVQSSSALGRWERAATVAAPFYRQRPKKISFTRGIRRNKGIYQGCP
ncbi:MAG: hypothetical protein Q7S03_02580 [bacterium]|nr:hypothetical protein [bacterium]